MTCALLIVLSAGRSRGGIYGLQSQCVNFVKYSISRAVFGYVVCYNLEEVKNIKIKAYEKVSVYSD